MASKKDSESIMLLSMYGDEDENDMEQDDSDNKAVTVKNQEQGEVSGSKAADMDEDDKVVDDKSYGYGNSNEANDRTTPVTIDRLTSPPAQQVIGVEPNRGRKRFLTIFDYGHDEGALSLVLEESEIAASRRVMFGAELQTVNGTPPRTVKLLTPKMQSTPQLFESQSDAMNYKGSN